MFHEGERIGASEPVNHGKFSTHFVYYKRNGTYYRVEVMTMDGYSTRQQPERCVMPDYFGKWGK